MTREPPEPRPPGEPAESSHPPGGPMESPRLPGGPAESSHPYGEPVTGEPAGSPRPPGAPLARESAGPSRPAGEPVESPRSPGEPADSSHPPGGPMAGEPAGSSRLAGEPDDGEEPGEPAASDAGSARRPLAGTAAGTARSGAWLARRTATIAAWSARRAVRIAAWIVRRIARILRWAARRIARYIAPETRPEWVNRLPANRYALTAFVGLALLALYEGASVARPGAPAPPRPVRTPVAALTVACPDAAGARISGATPPRSATTRSATTGAGTGAPVPGPAAPGRIQATGLTVAPPAPGVAWPTGTAGRTGPWIVTATGSLAPGLTVEQTTTRHGLAGTRCTEPATDLWFAGPGPADAEDVELSLTNTDGRPATVDVAGLSETGSIETPEGTAITVDGRTTRLIRVGGQVEGLGAGAAGARLIALHVQATAGRIAAAVRVRRAKGADWLPATAPGTRLVVPGVPPGHGRRRLLIAVPGHDVAAVRVQVITPDGVTAPGDQGTVQAAALTVTKVDLGLGGRPAGLRLVADRPVVAALVADKGDDFAATAAVAGLDPGGPGGVVADDRDKTALLFTAPDRAATVRVTRLLPGGPAGTAQDVTVPAGRTVEVVLPPPAGGDGYGLSIVPRPGSGPVYAARVLAIDKSGLTVLPVPPARTTVSVPPVRDTPLPWTAVRPGS